MNMNQEKNTTRHSYLYRAIEKKKIELALTKNFSWQFVRFQLTDVSLKS
jgi:hypothetical protein